MRIGQPVSLSADVYGSKVEYHGKIAGLAAGTGAAFALLPAQNASGNWIKVVQRVPVRISLDPQELAAHPLRIGLSMQVEVDLHEDGDSPLGVAPTAPVAQTDVFADLGKAARERIRAIISANNGGQAAELQLPEVTLPSIPPAALATPRRTRA
jgi:membrane fusion protein (multidrug efflux system)